MLPVWRYVKKLRRILIRTNERIFYNTGVSLFLLMYKRIHFRYGGSALERLYDIQVIKDVMERNGFSFSKKLGQNFLTDRTVCPKIAVMGGAEKGVGVIEIGPGIGVLTHELALRADKVCAVELDKRLIPVLGETLSEHGNVTVINADIMKLDLRRLIEEEFDGCDVKVCANLPYYITSPLIMRLLTERLPLSSVTVMVQKEAAVRLCAQTGTRECGAVTYAVRYFSEPKKLFNVSRRSFFPSPNVDSSVIRFDIKQTQALGGEDEKFFFRTVKAAFSQRRKTLCNSVSQSLLYERESVAEAAQLCGIDPQIRPEALGLKQMIAFSQALSEITKD